MKSRHGFVSNSSSSSFIIRGIRIKTKEVAKILNIDISEIEDLYEIYDAIESFLWKNEDNDLTIERDVCVFEESPPESLIIGKEIGRLEDGCISVIPDSTKIDVEIREKLESIGISEINLETYAQYVSNDNF